MSLNMFLKGIAEEFSGKEFTTKDLMEFITGSQETCPVFSVEPKQDKDVSVEFVSVLDNENDSDINRYYEKLEEGIKKIIKRDAKSFDINEIDILDDGDSEYTINQMKEELKRKQKTMKYGEIWQFAIGNFPGWEDLGVGHYSECDVRKKDNSIIIEIKNKYNTVNSGGKKDVERKLMQYKKNNPDTECIWGIVNEKHNNSKHNLTYEIDGYKITKLQGKEFLSLVFTHEGKDYSEEIIEKLRGIIS